MKKKKLADLSYYNGDIDFTEVSKNVDGVILREGYRKTIDSKFLSYVEQCRKNGIKIYCAYHFIYALNTDDGIKEAISCIDNVIKAGFTDPDEIYIVADYEYDTIKNAQKYGITLTKHDCNQITEAFCAAISNLGYKPVVYMNLDFYKNYYIDAIKNKYPIWLADYTGDADFPCFIHQYTNKGNIPGIKGNVDMNWLFENGNLSMESDSEPTRASKVVALAESWLGKNEKDGSYKKIIDIYNSYKGPFPRGVKMQYGWSWCACTWSALAIKLGYTNIMPIEISCGELVKAAQKMDCWVERDGYVPKPGDAVLYDWQDSSNHYHLDNSGWPDHIGLVVFISESEGYFVTIEGNYDNSVKKRTVSINGRYIRGFIHPKYDIEYCPYNMIIANKSIDTIAHEVICGLWGSGENRKRLLENNGYVYSDVQKRVNEILNGSSISIPNDPNTDLNQPYNRKLISDCLSNYIDPKYLGQHVATANLYLRNDAGTNKKALAIIPKGTAVQSMGCYNKSGDIPWLYVNFIMNGTYFGGFASSKYLVKQ